MSLTAEEMNELIEIDRILAIEKARESFWEFCKLVGPDLSENENDFKPMYHEGNLYLKNLANALQDFIEGKLISESGKEVYISQWMPLVAPKGLPESVLKTLSDSLSQVCTSDSFITSMTRMGLPVAHLSPEETRAFVADESARNERNIQALKQK